MDTSKISNESLDALLDSLSKEKELRKNKDSCSCINLEYLCDEIIAPQLPDIRDINKTILDSSEIEINSLIYVTFDNGIPYSECDLEYDVNIEDLVYEHPNYIKLIDLTRS